MNQVTIRQDVWKPASETDKASALAALSSLPSRPTTGELDRASYYTALDGVTRHGLSAAVRSILQGGLGHGFFPSPPELRIQCDKAMEGPRWDRSQQLREDRYARERRENNAITQRSPQAIARQQKAYQAFTAGYEADKIRADESERAEIRARYGITEEAIASIPDLPVSNFETPRIRSKS